MHKSKFAETWIVSILKEADADRPTNGSNAEKKDRQWRWATK